MQDGGHGHHRYPEPAGEEERARVEGLELLVFPAELPLGKEVEESELPEGRAGALSSSRSAFGRSGIGMAPRSLTKVPR